MDWGARAAVLLAFSAALPACNDSGDARSPAAITGDEERAVAEAAEMLDQRVPENAPDMAPGEPAAQSPTPTPDSIE